MKTPAALLIVALLALTGCTSSGPLHETDLKKSADANAELGLRYMLQGKNDIALDKLKKALDQNPDSAVAHHYLAELYRRLDEFDKADYHYRQAIDLNSEDSSIYNNYGVFLCSRKKYSQAEKQFKMALENPVYNGRARTLENLGTCVRDGGDPGAAEEYFRKALALDPRLVKSLLAMAEISFTKGNALSARGYLQRFSELAEPIPQSLWLGIRIERILGDRIAIATYGNTLKTKFPEAKETRLYLKGVKR